MSLEQNVRDYLRTKTRVMSLLNDDPTRLNMEWNGNIKATRANLYRAGGGFHDYMPLENAVISFHVYGSTRPAASDLAEAIGAEMRSLIPGPDSPLRTASVESITWLPLPDGTARYVVTTVVTSVVIGLAA